MRVKTVKYTVSGLVQGVGYRYFVLLNARKYNLNGYVRNLPCGDVEVVIQTENIESISQLYDALKKGPSGSYVKNVIREELGTDELYSAFQIL